SGIRFVGSPTMHWRCPPRIRTPATIIYWEFHPTASAGGWSSSHSRTPPFHNCGARRPQSSGAAAQPTKRFGFCLAGPSMTRTMRARSFSYLLGLAFVLSAASAARGEGLCARVRIEIDQRLSFERQAFEARMVITNGADVPLTEADV